MPNSDGRRKPRGVSSFLEINSAGVRRHFVELPNSKEEIEQFIAERFCDPNSRMKPQFERYGALKELTFHDQNSIDFSAETDLGRRWIELAEFAPLQEFEGKYDGLPRQWRMENAIELWLSLIRKKSNKQYGKDVILLIYNTDDRLLLPTPVRATVCKRLHENPPPFEAIFYISVNPDKTAFTCEIFPGDPNDSWALESGTYRIVT